MLSIVVFALVCSAATIPTQSGFSMQQVKSYPFPSGLTAAANRERIAWAMNQEGQRNVWVAQGPEYQARRLTEHDQDDGQEITSLQLSADGEWVVYLRGGDHGSNWDDDVPVNPNFNPDPPEVGMWSAPFEDGPPVMLGEGTSPTVSPKSDKVAFVHEGQVWTVDVDGSGKRQLFTARGSNGSPVWSPDGSQIAFVSNRDDHSYIGVYTSAETPISWIGPTFARDSSPRWSPDGKSIAFVRRAEGKTWTVCRADVANGEVTVLWTAPDTPRGRRPRTHGGTNLHWADGHIVFATYEDGWPHLYSIPEGGGEKLLLTPGDFMVEYVKMSPDRKWMVFCANTGDDPLDIDRRHVVRVPVNRAEPEVLTQGAGLEWTPDVTGDTITYISATAHRPPVVAVRPFNGGRAKNVTEHLIPSDFPTELVTPKQVVIESPDGVKFHCQLFEKEGGPDTKPAVIYVHGGPPRQMQLGWNYSEYYSNAYASNQYLASLGFVVLSVNFRLGIGYGYDFQNPENAGRRGASEYIDVKAAGQWLQEQPNIDPARVGIYGGSYGGFLTALALGRDSQIFAAGVDLHGVHDWTNGRGEEDKTAWSASPVSWIESWSSPVLVIHADDDRNVRFSQSTDLVRRLERQGVDYETLVIVDDTHHFMVHRNWLRVNEAVAEFLSRRLAKKE